MSEKLGESPDLGEFLKKKNRETKKKKQRVVWNDELGESKLRSRDVWAGSWKRMGTQGRLNLAQRKIGTYGWPTKSMCCCFPSNK